MTKTKTTCNAANEIKAIMREQKYKYRFLLVGEPAYYCAHFCIILISVVIALADNHYIPLFVLIASSMTGVIAKSNPKIDDKTLIRLANLEFKNKESFTKFQELLKEQGFVILSDVKTLMFEECKWHEKECVLSQKGARMILDKNI